MMQATKQFQIMMTPGQARLLSVAAIAALSVGFLGEALLGDPGSPLDLLLTVVRLAGLLATITLFLSNYGQMTQRKEAELDEREAQLRNRAYVLTHQVMISIVFLAFFYVEVATKLAWWLPELNEVANLLTAFGLASMALPAAILAWRDKPLPEEG
jgi:undecaprenyl pyrophosphate phosphatase UppP